jgi:hypothetical protein
MIKINNVTDKNNFMEAIKDGKLKINKVGKNKWILQHCVFNNLIYNLEYKDDKTFNLSYRDSYNNFTLNFTIEESLTIINKAKVNNKNCKADRVLKKYDSLAIMVNSFVNFGHIKIVV